eukprot:4234287-Pyramimonas_sp.AAC.1
MIGDRHAEMIGDRHAEMIGAAMIGDVRAAMIAVAAPQLGLGLAAPLSVLRTLGSLRKSELAATAHTVEAHGTPHPPSLLAQALQPLRERGPIGRLPARLRDGGSCVLLPLALRMAGSLPPLAPRPAGRQLWSDFSLIVFQVSEANFKARILSVLRASHRT